MSHTKHTPGPWVIEKLSGGWGVIAPNWGYVAFHVTSDLPHWNEGQEANRRLIAAAPDLLEALERIARPHDCGCVPCTGQCRSQIALEIAVEEMQELARAAIAKATGEGA
ncbi:hypothetical protein GUV60_02540 [Stenotrophomonas maltophilia]|nr:hypothetical protein [Stenotrophomonas maltophilia]